jgi:hypothetical protein
LRKEENEKDRQRRREGEKEMRSSDVEVEVEGSQHRVLGFKLPHWRLFFRHIHLDQSKIIFCKLVS